MKAWKGMITVPWALALEGVKIGLKGSPLWLDAAGKAEIPGVVIGWCCEAPIRLSAGQLIGSAMCYVPLFSRWTLSRP